MKVIKRDGQSVEFDASKRGKEELNKLKEEAEIELMADKDASPSMGDMQQQQ